MRVTESCIDTRACSSVSKCPTAAFLVCEITHTLAPLPNTSVVDKQLHTKVTWLSETYWELFKSRLDLQQSYSVVMLAFDKPRTPGFGKNVLNDLEFSSFLLVGATMESWRASWPLWPGGVRCQVCQSTWQRRVCRPYAVPGLATSSSLWCVWPCPWAEGSAAFPQ